MLFKIRLEGLMQTPLDLPLVQFEDKYTEQGVGILTSSRSAA